MEFGTKIELRPFTHKFPDFKMEFLFDSYPVQISYPTLLALKFGHRNQTKKYIFGLGNISDPNSISYL